MRPPTMRTFSWPSLAMPSLPSAFVPEIVWPPRLTVIPSAPMTSAVPGQCDEIRRERRARGQCRSAGDGRRRARRPPRSPRRTAPARRRAPAPGRAQCSSRSLLGLGRGRARPTVAGGGYRAATGCLSPPSERYGRRLGLVFRILGPLEVSSPEGPIRLGGPRQRSVLAILLLDANRIVSIDRLAEELYGGAPPVSAVTQVHRQISELRMLLEPERPAGTAGSVVETRPPGYRVRVAPDALDLLLVERLADDAGSALASGDAEAAVRALPAGARAVAGRAARRPRVRAVRPSRDRAPERAAPHDRGEVPRGRARARPRRGARGRARAARARQPAQRAPARPVDGRPVPRRPAGGRAGEVPRRDAPRSWRRSASSPRPR